MKADEYVLSLIDRGPAIGRRQEWTEVLLGLLPLTAVQADPDLRSLREMLVEERASEARSEVVRLRGPGFWRDDSPTGRAYRVINALATTSEEAEADPEQFWYGVVTAVELLAREGNDAVVIAAIQGCNF